MLSNYKKPTIKGAAQWREWEHCPRPDLAAGAYDNNDIQKLYLRNEIARTSKLADWEWRSIGGSSTTVALKMQFQICGVRDPPTSSVDLARS